MNKHQREKNAIRNVLRGLPLMIGIVASVACAQTVTTGSSTTTIHQSGGINGSRSEVNRDALGHRVVTRDGRSTDITIQRDDGGDAPAQDSVRPADVGRTASRLDQGRFGWRGTENREQAMQWSDTDSPAREALRQQMLERMGSSPLR